MPVTINQLIKDSVHFHIDCRDVWHLKNTRTIIEHVGHGNRQYSPLDCAGSELASYQRLSCFKPSRILFAILLSRRVACIPRTTWRSSRSSSSPQAVPNQLLNRSSRWQLQSTIQIRHSAGDLISPFRPRALRRPQRNRAVSPERGDSANG